ncbi:MULTISPECIES: hypothetical protein [Vibrio]|uniref:hypothetical protein n=1 Tax=Vibrio TaxID=662 RepID=UPI00177BEC56|nr:MULTISPECIES: hypothetical protein [Vibrio]MBD1567024.1 hypothetical protein [Vibrio sp. S12_S33]
MNEEVKPTRKPQEIYGNIVYLDDYGNTVIEHVSGGRIVVDPDGVGTFTRPDGSKVVIQVNGSTESFDPDDEYLFGTPPIQK